MAASLLEYLRGLSPIALSRLYSDPHTCQAVLRALPPLSRQYLLRLVGAHGRLAAEIVGAWPLPTAAAALEHKAALEQLVALRLVELDPVGREYALHAGLCEQIGSSICLARGAQAAEARLAADEARPSVVQLERHAQRTWEDVLQCVLTPPRRLLPLAGCGGKSTLQQLLLSLRLLEATGAEGAEGAEGVEGAAARWASTRAARRFVLLPIQEQVWRLMLEYMELTDTVQPGARDATLSFLMRLGSHAVGSDCSVHSLTELQRQVLSDLLLFGIAYQREESSPRFYATPLAHALLSGSAGLATSRRSEGFLILETNFKLYAHTSSPLWAQVIRSFARVEYVLPNLVVSSISREAIRDAVESGIEWDMIVQFLERNAHPLMAANVPVLPETVVNQVSLWAQESSRMQLADAQFYDKFESIELFDDVVQYAKDDGVYLWHKRDQQHVGHSALIVAAHGHQRMKAFLKSKK
ncbi:hypothetical protein AB1Y20_013237 [Prymnesium parvum]|uniref:General transcription factor IIH subunit 4 n=1 Tax=Prymnesium parvum TaxID=97485 RepID=A0AB34IMZ7_PRYPA